MGEITKRISRYYQDYTKGRQDSSTQPFFPKFGQFTCTCTLHDMYYVQCAFTQCTCTVCIELTPSLLSTDVLQVGCWRGDSETRLLFCESLEYPQQLSVFCMVDLSSSFRDLQVVRRNCSCRDAGAASTATDTLNMSAVETPRMTMYYGG